MRVACIEISRIEPAVTPLVKGNIYTVIDSRDIQDFRTKSGYLAENGLYYKLIETGNWYHHSLFIEINENQQDEKEIIKERELLIT